VAEAVDKLRALMFPEVASTAAGSAASATAGTVGGVQNDGGSGRNPNAATTNLGLFAQLDINQAIGSRDFSAGNEGAAAASLAAQAIASGWTQTDIAAVLGWSAGEVEDYFKNAAGIPKFAVGTNFVPRDMLAYIHQGEAVVPKAYNPAAGGAAPGQMDTSRLEGLMAQMLARLQVLEEHAGTTANVLARASQGDALTTAPAPTIA